MIVYIRIYKISSTNQINNSLFETDVDIDVDDNYTRGYIETNEIEFISEPPKDRFTLGIIVLKSGSIYYLDKYDIDNILFQMYNENPEKYYTLKDEYGTEIDEEEQLKRLDVTL